MEYPIEVKGIEFGKEEVWKEKCLFSGSCGSMVSVRPCGKEYEDKTYLGVLLGEISTSPRVEYNKGTGVLNVSFSQHNPAIFVPDINKIIFGYESWWGEIESEEQLHQITDADIENVWYVKALKELSEVEVSP